MEGKRTWPFRDGNRVSQSVSRRTRICTVYEREAHYVLAQEDCRQFLRELPCGSVDLTITSPPYFMGKNYDKSANVDDFVEFHKQILPEVLRVTKDGGSICWQVGYHVRNGTVTPLDFLVHQVMQGLKGVTLRNRIIWAYGHGLHSRGRFSGRHEVVLWYTRGKDHYFDLDSVRVPQKYPGKKHYKGSKKGEFSGNPLGKNPSDVWEIPNVKANHVEKTAHPCQFPVALAQRLIRGLSPANAVILDPFMGSGSTGVAAILEGRRFVGCEVHRKYYVIAMERCEDALSGTVRFRSVDKPIYEPNQKLGVAIKPSNFV